MRRDPIRLLALATVASPSPSPCFPWRGMPRRIRTAGPHAHRLALRTRARRRGHRDDRVARHGRARDRRPLARRRDDRTTPGRAHVLPALAGSAADADHAIVIAAPGAIRSRGARCSRRAACSSSRAHARGGHGLSRYAPREPHARPSQPDGQCPPRLRVPRPAGRTPRQGRAGLPRGHPTASGGVDVGGELSARVGTRAHAARAGQPREAQTLTAKSSAARSRWATCAISADAWNNMGAIEVQTGSRASATTYFQRAIECYRRLGAPTGTPVHNLALLLIRTAPLPRGEGAAETELAKRSYPPSSGNGLPAAHAARDRGGLPARDDAGSERMLDASGRRDSVPLASRDAAEALARASPELRPWRTGSRP